jgi:hypothetical protein
MEPGWRVGQLWWQWTRTRRSGRLGEFNVMDGRHELETAVLPSGEIVLADLDDLYPTRGDADVRASADRARRREAAHVPAVIGETYRVA